MVGTAYTVAADRPRRRAAEAEAYRKAIEYVSGIAAALAAKAERDAVWDRIAVCETGGNWSMTGSSYSGGVGFANSTWSAFGGQEFASNAGDATRRSADRRRRARAGLQRLQRMGLCVHDRPHLPVAPPRRATVRCYDESELRSRFPASAPVCSPSSMNTSPLTMVAS